MPASSSEGSVLPESTERAVPQPTAERTVPKPTAERTVPQPTAERTVPSQAAKRTAPSEAAESTVIPESAERSRSSASAERSSQNKPSSPSRSGFCKRIIPCLDIADGRIVKGVKFSDLKDAGDPVVQSLVYEEQGADEIMFLDITASNEGRKTTRALVREVARQLSIPLTVGGGISAVGDVEALLEAGADKVSMNTAAVLNPELINGVAESFGSQCCVVAIDARLNAETGRWKVLIRGGREDANLDALDWAKECIARGAGEILLTSWDFDGTKQGFDLKLTSTFSKLPVPIIASGGAAGANSFVDVFKKGNADAALAASIFHFSEWTVAQIKEVLKQQGVNVRV